MFKFNLIIMTLEEAIFEGEAKSVILTGDKSEFELLAYHSPLISILERGEVLIDNEISVPLRKGIVRFYNNECIILTEQDPETLKKIEKKKKEKG